MVKAASPGQLPVVYFNAFFDKFKPIEDILGLKYKEKYPDIKFSLAPPVESENFKRWFGDSKVVDAAGKPLVVYHGTDYNFNIFRSHDGNNEFFFTDDQNAARDYGEKQMSLFLSMQNPYIVDLGGEGDAVIYDAIDYAKKNGHDGVIAKNAYDGANTHTEYVVFKNTQVKSATDNNGSYDPENPDIRYSLSDYSEADRSDLIKVIKPYVGRNMNKSDADYLKFFKDKNLPVYTEADAHEIAATALYENREDGRRNAAQKRDM